MTIKEIAKLCNVSTATVSNVINGKNKAGHETTKRILDMVEKTGYHPNYIAKGLRTQSTTMIGVIVEDITQFHTPNIIDGIMQGCEKNGYNVILENMRLYSRWQGDWFDNPEKYQEALQPALKELERIKVDGIIYVAGHGRRITQLHQNEKTPMVMAYAFPGDPQIPSVVIDDKKGAYDMTKHLLSKGHKRIGVIAGEQENFHTIMRMEGYQMALSEEGISYNPNIIEYERWERSAGFRAASKMISGGVTAIFCMSDIIAGGVYDYMSEQGIVIGKDMALVGYDNRDIAEYMAPGLTTMALPLYGIGLESAEKLIAILKGEPLEAHFEQRIGCSLIERKSVMQME